jgi:hypothetical protein
MLRTRRCLLMARHQREGEVGLSGDAVTDSNVGKICRKAWAL